MGQAIGSAGARCGPESAPRSPRHSRGLRAGWTKGYGINVDLPAQAMHCGMTTECGLLERDASTNVAPPVPANHCHCTQDFD
jgi:hypothetical protein